MYISKTTADSLINEIRTIIDYDISIVDEKGFILSSTNVKREGIFHEGAYRVISENLDEFLIYRNDEYEGCNKGVNLPIVLNGVTIGVIGITGEVSETIKYGNLIRKISQILIGDIVRLHEESDLEQNKLKFFSSWIAGDLNDEEYIVKNLKKFNLDSYENFIVAVFSYRNKPDFDSYITSNPFCNAAFIDMGKYGVIICNCSKASDFTEYVLPILYRQKLSDSFLCTISRAVCSHKDVPLAYNDAMCAHKLAYNNKTGVVYYKDEMFNILLNDIDQQQKKEFVSNIFVDCHEKEIEDFAYFIEKYYTHNGSINSIAADLFVHKNTVQYKINKIYNRTNLDLRKYDHLFKLHLAATWYLAARN